MAFKQRVLKGLDIAGLTFCEPFVRLLYGENPREQFRKIFLYVGVPVLAFGLFLLAWTGVARSIHTKYGTVPTPVEVWTEASNLVDDHYANRAAEAEYYAKQQQRADAYQQHAAALRAKANGDAALLAKAAKYDERAEKTRERRFSSAPTYLDQIWTSLTTVFAGFVIASAIAIPIGILCGLNPLIMAALNPLIQLFKPVSPLAWLPIVMIIVGALYTTDPQQAWFSKSFISSAVTVALCSLWPTLVNTALGVASVDRDHINVARVLRLGWFDRVTKIVVPSALPLIFTGLRISLGVGWMVLIAAEMLAQNPGLGKFVWDMFQNGSSTTLAQIMVAVFTIGVIGLLLDRTMIALQKSVSYDSAVAA